MTDMKADLAFWGMQVQSHATTSLNRVRIRRGIAGISHKGCQLPHKEILLRNSRTDFDMDPFCKTCVGYLLPCIQNNFNSQTVNAVQHWLTHCECSFQIKISQSSCVHTDTGLLMFSNTVLWKLDAIVVQHIFPFSLFMAAFNVFWK